MNPNMINYRTRFHKNSTQICLILIELSLNKKQQGCLGGSVVEHLPSAQGVIPELWDQVPHWAPCMEPASLSAYVSASLCVCLS